VSGRVHVEVVSPTDLHRLRNEALDRTSLSEEALRCLGCQYALRVDEQAILEEMDRIDFLLGGDVA
jgi:hypothetical protein